MNVITTFTEKKREKQIKYEKSVLREISIKTLKEKVQQLFGSSRFVAGLLMNNGIEEACYDVAIEAYLLGAHFSRFGFYGETIETVKYRCRNEEQHLIDTLYHFFLYWGSGEEGIMSESLYYLCGDYVSYWWMEGFQKGERRHRLRLH
ncbi:YbaK family protein [Bacillus sp. FJAT-49705]|uniref:YbaK family protein n=1 Tax=Cytobacillus citreus TaxID=2833586 RepID=A0ABS5NZT2_9BACI|nr:YbaK family protein [Cytobacillus citreus]MBS4193325.1 YbaK family protein [Cytobacillus citreus]